jgi:hypothetical protein
MQFNVLHFFAMGFVRNLINHRGCRWYRYVCSLAILLKTRWRGDIASVVLPGGT